MRHANTLIKTSKLYTGSFKNSIEENYTKMCMYMCKKICIIIMIFSRYLIISTHKLNK